MNEFERQLREAIAASRAKVRDAEDVLRSPLTQMAMGGLIAGSAASSLRPPEGGGQERNDMSRQTGPKVSALEARAGDIPVVKERSGTAATSAMSLFSARSASSARIGFYAGEWTNRCVAAAIPALLLLERTRGQKIADPVGLRTQLVREIHHFQQSLLKQQFLPEDVQRMSYMLCTYVDSQQAEISSLANNLSLLVEFHRDSWGGERCFEDLDFYMKDYLQYKEVLGLYHVILSLGFKGKYQVLPRGDVLLSDVFIRLNKILYENDATQSLSLARAVKSERKRSLITPLKLFLFFSLLLLLIYGGVSLYLHDQSRQIRNAILAWEPPVPRKINIMETLPQPLPKILSEGWLQVREDPRGWLLIFTSDGAFETGRSTLSAEFASKRNIERLGEALAGWPGDLEVIGHTDAQPFRLGSSTNLKLSLERAETVADKLRQGTLVNSKYQREIDAIGKGDTEPLADNATDVGRKKNRRVDILWKVGQRANKQALLDEIGQKKTEEDKSQGERSPRDANG